MKNIKPTYYDRFSCIAGACSFTCCRDWEIAIDQATQERWKGLGIDTSKLLRPGIAGDCMKLKADGTCLFLRPDGLCSQVLDHGEESLSITCHTFPREVHEFGDRKEYTLTMGCPEALRLLFAEDRFSVIENSDPSKNNKAFADGDPSMLLFRTILSDLVQNRDYSPEEALRAGFLLALNFYENGPVSEKDIEKEFRDSSLSEIRKAMSRVGRDDYDNMSEQNELFLDLVENYRKKGIYSSLIEPLASRMEYYEDPDREEEFIRSRKEFEVIWGKSDKYIRLLLAEEIYSTLYLPGGNEYTAVLKLEWLAIFYAALKQALFVTWENKGGLSDMDLVQTVILLIRITGYSEDDIEEYLENSFESAVWDWGYFALIV